MNNYEKILYYYFLEDNKILKIPFFKDKHKKKLLDAIRKIYPAFIHPYSFGYMSNNEANDSSILIGIFDNNRINIFKRLKNKIIR